MEAAPAHAVAVPLTAAQRDQVRRAAAAAGQTVEEFMTAAALAAATDPFLTALEHAADTIAARAERIQHDYAH
ncbi:hypothetical protein [Streptomyces wuyuanensis]|uniref:hypothetical protein n=1 Tax=Streptomyces wuyuanensis TaxID=1196353 RepID=UPI00371A73B3